MLELKTNKSAVYLNNEQLQTVNKTIGLLANDNIKNVSQLLLLLSEMYLQEDFKTNPMIDVLDYNKLKTDYQTLLEKTENTNNDSELEYLREKVKELRTNPKFTYDKFIKIETENSKLLAEIDSLKANHAKEVDSLKQVSNVKTEVKPIENTTQPKLKLWFQK